MNKFMMKYLLSLDGFLSKEQKFGAQDKSFIVHCERDVHVYLTRDASRFGLGAVLSQNGRPITEISLSNKKKFFSKIFVITFTE